MEEFIYNTLDHWGYVGIFLLITLENIFPPIPSEVILTFSGFATTRSTLTVTGVILFSTMGSILGAVILYSLGRIIDTERIISFVSRWQKYLRITPGDIQKAANIFQKYGAVAVFLGRLVPLIRSLISIPAGMTRMNIWTFLGLTTAGSFIWNSTLVLVGAYLGFSWQSIVAFMDVYAAFVYLLLAIPAIAFVVWYFKQGKETIRFK